MLTYEYECAKCRATFEVDQKISDEPVRQHDGCGGAVKRLIPRSTSFVLKGNGWFKDGYK